MSSSPSHSLSDLPLPFEAFSNDFRHDKSAIATTEERLIPGDLFYYGSEVILYHSYGELPPFYIFIQRGLEGCFIVLSSVGAKLCYFREDSYSGGRIVYRFNLSPAHAHE